VSATLGSMGASWTGCTRCANLAYSTHGYGCFRHASLHDSRGKTNEPMPAYVLKSNPDSDSIHTKLLSNAIPTVDCAYELIDERKLVVVVDKVSM